MIGLYSFHTIEEIARGVIVAVIAAASAAVYAQGVPTSRETLVSMLVGLLPVAYAAVRAALNHTSVTPSSPPAQEPMPAPPAAP